MLVEKERYVNRIWFIDLIEIFYGIDTCYSSYGYYGDASLYLAQRDDLDGRYEKISSCVDSTCDSSACVRCCL